MHDLEAAIIIFYARYVSQHSSEKRGSCMLDEMFQQNILLLVFQKYNKFF